MTRRWRWIRAGAVAGVVALGLGSLALAWSTRDPWPTTRALPAPARSWPDGFTPDGRSFLTRNNEGSLLWDVATGQSRRPWPALNFAVHAFAPDGKSALGVHGHDPESAAIGCVDLASGAFRDRFAAGHRDVVHLAFVDGGRAARILAADADGVVREVIDRDLASGAEARRPLSAWDAGLAGTPRAVSPDGRTLAYFNRLATGLQFWDAAADTPIGGLVWGGSIRLIPHGAAAFSPDGRTLLVARDDGMADLWDVATRRPTRAVRLHPPGFASVALRFAPDGQAVLSTGHFHAPASWGDAARAAYTRAVAGQGRSVYPGEVAVVDLATGRTLARATGAIAAAFSPDGRTVAIQEADRTFTLRDAPRPPAP